MSTNKTTQDVVIIDDDMVNRAIAAIEATEPTAEERESAQLAKLIPVICAARASGEPDERIRRKLKSVMPKLHYRKVNSLFEAATELANDQHDQVQGSAQ